MKFALVTLYNPNRNVIENIKTISSQVDQIILCDNSRINNTDLFSCIKKSVYIFNNANLGLSTAFNKVLKIDDNFSDDDYIIFFDQDSKIEENHIANLIEEYELLESKNINIGCLGPVFFNTSSESIEVPKQKKKLTEHIFEVKSLITSSMICRYSKIKRINFWNEEIFLDMADWDLCWRFIENGMLCCMTDSVVLHHSLGKGERKFLFFRIREGNSFREYYQTRDCLYLLKKKYVPVKYRIRFFLMIIVRPIIHYIFLSDKKERIKYIVKGIIDYKKNIKGSL